MPFEIASMATGKNRTWRQMGQKSEKPVWCRAETIAGDLLRAVGVSVNGTGLYPPHSGRMDSRVRGICKHLPTHRQHRPAAHRETPGHPRPTFRRAREQINPTTLSKEGRQLPRK